MPIRVCADPSCPQPATYRGRCREHAARNERTGRRVSRGFYQTKRWKITRRAYLFDHPICEQCDAELATDVHHRADLADGGSAYHPGNLQALCHACHSQITRARQEMT